MPIYGYACKACGHTLDALQKMADDPLVDCPECEQPELKRQLSAPRFRLKGQGWYETDFKKDNQRNLAGDKKPDGDKKSDAKESPGEKSDKKSDKSDKQSPGGETKASTSKDSGGKSKASAA